MSRIIKGQAWIHENTSLVQDMTIVYDNGRRVSCPAQILISDIWSDLDKATGNEWKRLDVDSSFFYWEYEYTNLETFVDEVTKFECPKPTKEYYDEKFPNIDPRDWDLSTLNSDWAKYWAEMVKISNINYSKLSIWKDVRTSLGGAQHINNWSGVGDKQVTGTSSQQSAGQLNNEIVDLTQRVESIETDLNSRTFG